MKRVVPAFVFVLVAVMGFFALIPEFTTALDLEAYFRSQMSPELRRLDSLRGVKGDSLRSLQGAYERLLALESVDALPASAARVTISAARGVPASSREAFAQLLRDELAPLGDSIRYPIRLHLLQDSLIKGGYVRIAVLPRRDGAPCSVVVLLAANAPRALEPTTPDRLVGPCGFYAAFGAPGRGMAEWLIATRGIHATTDRARPQALDARNRMRSGEVMRAPDIAACIAGNSAVCAESFAGYEWTRRVMARDSLLVAATAGTVRMNPYASAFVPGRNLSDLRDAMTDERFARWWRSEKDPVVAYEEIEGSSIGDFVRERLLLEIEPHRPGPLHADLPLALGIAIGAIAAALAIRLTKRQRSGV